MGEGAIGDVERWWYGEPAPDVWITDDTFQCDRCSYVQPKWLAARTSNGTLVCEGCHFLIGDAPEDEEEDA